MSLPAPLSDSSPTSGGPPQDVRGAEVRGPGVEGPGATAAGQWEANMRILLRKPKDVKRRRNGRVLIRKLFQNKRWILSVLCLGETEGGFTFIWLN